MPLEQQLNDTLKQAMKDKDQPTSDVVRMIKTKIMERRTAKGFTGEVDDALITDVIAAYKKTLQKARRGVREARRQGQGAGRSAALRDRLLRALPAEGARPRGAARARQGAHGRARRHRRQADGQAARRHHEDAQGARRGQRHQAHRRRAAEVRRIDRRARSARGEPRVVERGDARAQQPQARPGGVPARGRLDAVPRGARARRRAVGALAPAPVLQRRAGHAVAGAARRARHRRRHQRRGDRLRADSSPRSRGSPPTSSAPTSTTGCRARRAIGGASTACS